MNGRVTPLALVLLTVTTWALALAVLSARPELLVAALPAVLALATLVARPAAPRFSVRYELSADRLFEGERVAVTVEVTAATAVPILELVEPLPEGCALVSGCERAVLALRRGQTARFSYELRCPARGVYHRGAVAVRARDGWGLRAWEARHVDARWVRVYPRVTSLRILPRPAHTQTSIGDYVSTAVGEGIEPGDIRQFAPGDRIRQVNWRASLRLGALHVNQRHRERNADVVLMLDTLAHVGAAPDTTLDHGVRAAACVATAYLARKDRVGLIVYGGLIDWVRPAAGRVQYERLIAHVLRADVVFTYVAKDLALVPPRVLPPQALVLAITPLLDPRFTTAALDLAARGFDVVVLAVSPVDVTRSLLPATAANDLACRLWALERRARLDEVRRHGLPVLEWSPSQPLEPVLARLKGRRPRVAVAR